MILVTGRRGEHHRQQANAGRVVHCGSCALMTASCSVNPDLRLTRPGAVLWLLPPQEGLDDTHAAPAASAHGRAALLRGRRQTDEGLSKPTVEFEREIGRARRVRIR